MGTRRNHRASERICPHPCQARQVNQWPRLVWLWEQVNQIIEEQLKSWKKPGKLPVNVFGNLAHCACGSKMYVRTKSPKYVCRACKNKIPIVDLEAIFRDELKGFFANRDRIAEHLRNARDNRSEKETLLAAHEKSIQGIREDMTRTHGCIWTVASRAKDSASSTNQPKRG
jgi:hypothetical protein